MRLDCSKYSGDAPKAGALIIVEKKLPRPFGTAAPAGRQPGVVLASVSRVPAILLTYA